MKALVLAREGKKAVLLLPGGEMRTVRAKRDWQTGMEVSVKPYPLPKKNKRIPLRTALVPVTAFAAALVIVIGGFSLLGGNHIDRQQPVQPLASGMQRAETSATDAPAPSPSPTAVPSPVPTAVPVSEQPVQPVQPIPGRQERCDECGAYGHDDDDCPDQICDACGQKGHDDDRCPNERCDECGAYGHDDDDCPDQICDVCGQKGHDDDHCLQKHNGRHHDD